MPAISIVIPTYNCEEYISATLDSLLAQTLQDFELIVIDDCSTDRSLEIIESYIPKFGRERFQLIKRRENSGSGTWIRNEFVNLATGKYMLFLDNDDLLMSYALQTFFEIGEQFNADVVFAERYFWFTDEDINPTTGEINVKIDSQIEDKNFVDTPTLETQNLYVKIDKHLHGRFSDMTWNKIYRREFLLDNQIIFRNVPMRADGVFAFEVVFFAKIYVRIPQILNLYRVRKDSGSHFSSPKRAFRNWLRDMIRGVDAMDQFLLRQKIFDQNPQLKFDVLDRFFQHSLQWISKSYFQLEQKELDEILYREIAEHPSTAFTVHLFHVVELFRKEISMLLKERE